MGGVVKKAKKLVKKVIPKEVKPFLPYIASAYFGPAAGKFMVGANPTGILANQAFQKAIGKGLVSGVTAAATDDDANILRSATLAAAPDAMLQGGLGAAGSRLSGTANIVDEFAPTLSQDVGRLLTKAADSNIVNLAANPTRRNQD
jgi:hypothetical protein